MSARWSYTCNPIMEVHFSLAAGACNSYNYGESQQDRGVISTVSTGDTVSSWSGIWSTVKFKGGGGDCVNYRCPRDIGIVIPTFPALTRSSGPIRRQSSRAQREVSVWKRSINEVMGIVLQHSRDSRVVCYKHQGSRWSYQTLESPWIPEFSSLWTLFDVWLLTFHFEKYNMAECNFNLPN